MSTHEPVGEEPRATRAPAGASAATSIAWRPADDQIGRILALQRSAGNRAVRALISPSRDVAERAESARGLRPLEQLARQPTKTQPEQAPLPPPADKLPIAVSQADRQTIKDETTAEILTAFTAFTDACQANLTAMKAAAKANAELAVLFIDIATGFLAPAFATWASGKLAARAATKAGTSLTEGVSKEVVRQLISTTDKLKAGFTGATKGVGQVLKEKSTSLFGEGDEDALLDELKKEFQRNVVTLAGQLHKMSDDELVAAWIAYDPDVANVTTYKAKIKELLDEFDAARSIGNSLQTGHGHWVSKERRAYRIDAYGKNDRLIILEETQTPYTRVKRFVGWVPEYFEDTVIKINAEVHGETTKIDPKEISGHFPDPATGE